MIKFPDVSVASDDFAGDVMACLSQTPKSIPSRWLYDAAGAKLFEKITELEEYYPTRTEIAILEQYSTEIAGFIGNNAALIEYGSGSSRKTKLLLRALDSLAAYIPIDISEEMLRTASAEISRLFPHIDVFPVVADFMKKFDLPTGLPAASRRIAFFPGSTIGNLEAKEAVDLLRRMGAQLGTGGRAIVGFDLKKDTALLLAAYDDAPGVTAAFNKNLLKRINRELDGDFDLDAFAHEARWNAAQSRIEMHLVSRTRQKVRIANRIFAFEAGESIHTENSHKYSVAQLTQLAERSGWGVDHIWIDSKGFFVLAGLAR